MDDVAITVAVQKAGARLISCTENVDDTPTGKLTHGIMATIGEFLAQESIKGMTSKAKLGGTPTRAPIGYRNVRIHSPGRPRGIATVELDAERSEHVRWAFEEYATGKWTLTTITDALSGSAA